MERKVFWVSFIVLSLIADLALPILWALVATIPIGILPQRSRRTASGW